MTVLFISDIHLSPERPEIFRAFSKFLSEHAKDVSALYVLGDLFDAWIGDDDPSDLAANTKKALREISDAGVELFIQRGNRDFTIGRKFSKDIRGTIIKDEHIVSSGQQSALVMHGDSLCTDDIDYQRFRRKSRNPIYRWCLINLPLKTRLGIAKRWRNDSASATSNKAIDIMDVNEDAVLDVMKKHKITTLIHGHTHRPKIHEVSEGQRIVLGDWESQGWFVSMDKEGFSLESFPIEP